MDQLERTMSLHINRFIDSVKAHESRGQKDFIMPMRDAKDLLGDITKLLLALEQTRTAASTSAEPVTIELSGGGFKNS
jgi:hypothetical protein